jgi:hypothetical protein
MVAAFLASRKPNLALKGLSHSFHVFFIALGILQRNQRSRTSKLEASFKRALAINQWAVHFNNLQGDAWIHRTPAGDQLQDVSAAHSKNH